MRFALAAALLLTPGAALAQDAEATSPAAACILDVWPSRGLHTVYYGWAHGGTIDGALKRRDGYPPVPVDLLAPAEQAEVLRNTLDVAALGLDASSTDFHDAAQTAVDRAATAEGTACRSELVVQNVALQQDFASGKHLNVIYRLHRAATAEQPAWTYSTFIATKIEIALEGDDAGSIEAISAVLREGFARNFKEFSKRAAIAAQQTSSRGKHK